MAAIPPGEHTAKRHDGGLTTASRPQKFTCEEDENELWLVKLAGNTHGGGKGIFNEQVAGLAGRLLAAPVAGVALVRVPQALAEALSQDPTLQLDYVPEPGVHHGSLWVGANMSDRMGIAYVDENRERLGALQVLYTWLACASDHQWIYDNDAPHEVFSVDHMAFFPNGPHWTEAGLQASVGNVTLDPAFSPAGLTASDRASTVARLKNVTDQEIAEIVARPPDEWGVTLSERIAVASYLSERRERVVDVCS